MPYLIPFTTTLCALCFPLLLRCPALPDAQRMYILHLLSESIIDLHTKQLGHEPALHLGGTLHLEHTTVA